MCSSDLCLAAANSVLDSLNWSRDSIDALIMVTQSPDYFLPSTACVIQDRLGLSKECASFDVGLGCSGYPYGLWLAAMMLKSGGFAEFFFSMEKRRAVLQTIQTVPSPSCSVMPVRQLPLRLRIQ